jgi:hypothetical protein
VISGVDGGRCCALAERTLRQTAAQVDRSKDEFLIASLHET